MNDSRIITLTSLAEPGAHLFASLTEAQLRSGMEDETGIFIAESPKVIRVALDAGLEPVALLCERRHLTGDAADIVARCADIPVYTGERELLARLTGYTLTRGVLCAMRRPEPKTVEDVCAGARRVCIIDGVCDTTNIGAIFRSAAALPEFTQVERHDVGKAHLVGKVQLDQLVIDFQDIASGSQGDDAASAGLDTLVDDTGSVEGCLMGAIVGRLHDGGIDFLVSREGSKLDFVLWTVVPVGNLMNVDVGYNVVVHLFYHK